MKKLFFNLLLFFLSVSLTAQNNEGTSDVKPKWEFDVTPYMWFISLKGEVSFLNQSVPVDTEFKDIWNQLSFGFLLHAEAQKGPWTIMTDFIYLNLKEDGTIKNTAQTTSTETKQIIWELGGGYRLLKLQDYFVLEGIAGMRYFALAPEFDINQQTVFDKSFDFIDPYIGLRFKSLNEKWINYASFDIGGLGIGSEISWKLNLTVGYQFSDLFALNVGYQGYYVNYDGDNSFEYDVFTGGFLAGLNFSF